MKKENCLFIHVTLIPYIEGSGELKSKPTQHSVRELRANGITPDLIVCRCDQPLPSALKEKISLFCNVQPGCVIEVGIELPGQDQHRLVFIALELLGG